MRYTALSTLVLFLVAACGGGGGSDGGADADASAPDDRRLAMISSTGRVSGFLPADRDIRGVVLHWGPAGSHAGVATPLLTSADSGRELEFPVGTSAPVDDWVLDLTNGSNNPVAQVIEVVPGITFNGLPRMELDVLEDRDPRLRGVDLVGSTVTRIVVTLRELTLRNVGDSYVLTYSTEVAFHGRAPGIGLPAPNGPPIDETRN